MLTCNKMDEQQQQNLKRRYKQIFGRLPRGRPDYQRLDREITQYEEENFGFEERKEGGDLTTLTIEDLLRQTREAGIEIKRGRPNRLKLIENLRLYRAGEIIIIKSEQQKLAENNSITELLSLAKNLGYKQKRGRPSKAKLADYIVKNTKYKKKEKIYQWLYKPTFKLKNKRGNSWYETQANIPVILSTKSEIKAKIKLINEKILQQPYYEKLIKYILKRHKNVPVTDLKKVKMTRAVPSSFKFINAELNDSENGQCVYNYIEKQYNMKREKLLKLVNDFEEERSMFNYTPLTLNDGLSCEHLEVFCAKKKISMYAIGLDRKAFHCHIPKERTTKGSVKPLMFVMLNDHMYPITDKKSRAIISQNENPNNKGNSLFVKKQEKQEEEDKFFDLSKFDIVDQLTADIAMNSTKSFIVRSDNIEDLYFSLVSYNPTRKVYYPYKYISSRMISIEIDNRFILANQDIDSVLEMCNMFNIPFNNQRVASLFNIIAKNTELLDMKYSCTNPIITNEFEEQTEIGAFNDCFTSKYKSDDLVGIDANNFYIDCLINTDVNWAVANIFDEIQPYDNTPIIESGFYFVLCNNYFPAKGSSWYSGEFVIFLKEQNIEFKITHKFIPSYTMKADTFKPIVYLLKDKLSKKCFKSVVLQFIGCLNKTYSSKGSITLCPDINSTSYIYFKEKQRNENTFVECIEENDIFKVSNTKKYRKQKTNSFMYIQLMNRSWIKLYETTKKCGGELVALKTDKIILYKPVNIKAVLGDSIGTFKYEAVKNNEVSKKHIRGIKQLTSCPYENKEWETIVMNEDVAEYVFNNNRSVLITGDGGSGKTYQMKRLKMLLDDNNKKYKCLAFTNKAALNLEGTTIHKFFSIDFTKPDKEIKKNLNGLEVLIIDEISMVQSNLYYALVKARRYGVKLIMLGDFKQLPPVGEEYIDFENTSLLKYLCDNNRIVMTKNRRYDEETTDIVRNLKIEKLEKINEEDIDYTVLKTHISWTNETRKRINLRCMEVNRGKDYFEVSDNMFIYEGLPLICTKADSKRELVKGCSYTVESITKDEMKANIKGEIYNEEDLINLFEPGYCTTVHCKQGDTITRDYCIFETDRVISCNSSSDKWLYTALSRCSHYSNIKIVL